MPENIELFTAKVCPYAHRTRLVLAEKNIPFDLTEIDFDAKPARFLAVSPYGKVPALVHDGHAVYESAIVNEYLDEVFPSPAMRPADAWGRAQMRIWIDYCDNRFLDDYYDALYLKDKSRIDELRDKVVGHLRHINDEGLAKLSDGPYWLGDAVSLLDCAYYPFFERLPGWMHHRGIEIPAECTRLTTWIATMENRTAVKSIANPPAYYIERYRSHAA